MVHDKTGFGMTYIDAVRKDKRLDLKRLGKTTKKGEGKRTKIGKKK
jgi:hypothetical protein